jgi:hypothetical protein
MYFNECMTGFEYEAAGHMVSEGMVQEGMAITRTVHDRYAASKRNPWNEVECSDHYARCMSVYGVFIAACGFDYHGPKGHLGFAPQITPENFRAPFTAAEGWGTYSQSSRHGKIRAKVQLKYGRLRLRTLSLAAETAPTRVRVTQGGRNVEISFSWAEKRLQVDLLRDYVLNSDASLVVRVG